MVASPSPRRFSGAPLVALVVGIACGPRAPVPAPSPAPPPPTATPDPVATPAPQSEAVGVRWVAPGLVDAHAHPQSLGRHLGQLRLNGLPTRAATLAAVAAAAPADDGWVRGRGWDHTDWTDHDGGFPSAADLDTLFPDRPVALRRVGGHATWVNTAALAAAGITADTPDPEGGRILRDPTGEATGVLIDAAGDLLPKAPSPSPETLRQQLALGLEVMASTGLTGAHDMGVSDATLSLYEQMDAEGALRLRIFAYLNPDAEAVARLKAEGPWCGRRLCVVGVKMYADGALGSRGALLSAPYADEDGHVGLAINDPAVLEAEATALLRAGAQLAVHAIGDAGIHGVLDAFEAARAAVPAAAAVPLRVEHLQVVRPEDLARLAPLNVVASMQPTHATSDMPWVAARLGADRVPWSYAWQDVRASGALLVFGSDFPVEEVSPSYGLWAATTRTDLAGQPAGGWRPDQALSLPDAVRAFSTDTLAALPPSVRAQADSSGDHTTLVAAAGPEGRGGDGLWWGAVETVVGGQPVWAAP